MSPSKNDSIGYKGCNPQQLVRVPHIPSPLKPHEYFSHVYIPLHKGCPYPTFTKHLYSTRGPRSMAFSCLRKWLNSMFYGRYNELGFHGVKLNQQTKLGGTIKSPFKHHWTTIKSNWATIKSPFSHGFPMFFPHFSHDLPLDPGSCELSHGFCTTLLREVSIVMLGLTETAQYAGSTSGSKVH